MNNRFIHVFIFICHSSTHLFVSKQNGNYAKEKQKNPLAYLQVS
ncbi:hypothetical protein BAT_0311 [Bacillus pumilus ATCC 7061]|nr:hypothetical protein BAT_0311 [Bacillus pumilus ATCC 7061]